MEPTAPDHDERGPDDYRRVASLREALRRFMRRSEQIAATNGLTPQRQLLLLLIRLLLLPPLLCKHNPQQLLHQPLVHPLLC